MAEGTSLLRTRTPQRVPRVQIPLFPILMKKLLIGILLTAGLLLAFYPRPYAILKAREGAGLFSMMTDVVAILNAYEKGAITGVEIDFGAEGLYYEPSEGPNWWLYFCEPLKKGTPRRVVRGCYGQIPGVPPYQFFTTREEVHSLIEKHIRFKPDICVSVETFCKAHFTKSYTVGVHYRGTDWCPDNKYPQISYAAFGDEVERLAQGHPSFQIFVATDEQPFLDYMQSRFGEQVTFQEGAYRSQGRVALHTDPHNNQCKQAREAIIDCLLLSRTDAFVGTRSNLSRWASFFNPSIPYICLDASNLAKPVGSI